MKFGFAVFGLAVLLASPMNASAATCAAAKLKGLGAALSGLLQCEAKVASTNDASGLAACRTKNSDKLTEKFSKAGTCVGNAPMCSGRANTCVAAVVATLADTLPSKCEAAKLKAGAKLVKAELSCHAKANKAEIAVDPVCLAKARTKFATALIKAGNCPDGGSLLSLIETQCVWPTVTTDGDGAVVDICPSLNLPAEQTCCDANFCYTWEHTAPGYPAAGSYTQASGSPTWTVRRYGDPAAVAVTFATPSEAGMPTSGAFPDGEIGLSSYNACRVPYCFGAHLPDGTLSTLGTWSVDTIVCPAGMSHYDTFPPATPASPPQLARWSYCQSDTSGEACYVWDQALDAWLVNHYGLSKGIPPGPIFAYSNICGFPPAVPCAVGGFWYEWTPLQTIVSLNPPSGSAY